MAATHKKHAMADHHGAIWHMVDWLEEHLRRHHVSRGVQVLTKTRIKRKLSRGLVFFKNADELDAYMKDLR